MQPEQQAALARLPPNPTDLATPIPRGVRLGEEEFLATTVELAPGVPPFVRLSVLKSYDKAAAFLDSLNRVLLGLGVLAVVAGRGLIFLISNAFTKPLANLVSGVRALEVRPWKMAAQRRRPLPSPGGTLLTSNHQAIFFDSQLGRFS